MGDLEVSVRRATEADANAVWELVRQFSVDFVPTRERFQLAFGAARADAGLYVSVAEADGEIVGYILATHHLSFFADGPVVWVEEIMVDPRYRLRGVGRALLQSVVAWAQEGDASEVALATKRAADIYTTAGYEGAGDFFIHVLGDSGTTTTDDAPAR